MSNIKKVSVSELKAHALQLIESVKTSQLEIEVYKRGQLVAKITPIGEETPKKSWLGLGADTMQIVGDPSSILEPLDVKWAVLDE